jgi:hypothetical protein
VSAILPARELELESTRELALELSRDRGLSPPVNFFTFAVLAITSSPTNFRAFSLSTIFAGRVACVPEQCSKNGICFENAYDIKGIFAAPTAREKTRIFQKSLLQGHYQ